MPLGVGFKKTGLDTRMIPDLRITVLRRFHPDEVFGESYPI